ncbi:MAG: galactitol-1-phosphate 5-dehydrogenase [Eubacteriales bacterium]|nr:galactitol-1-phosphate 5-dehydrogenase [Eubacteriales bacterium]
MKACVLHAIGDLRVEDVPQPVPKKGEVLLKIMASGICGSDIGRVFDHGTYHFPTIPGHEFAGQIVGVGKGVDKELIGKKAAVFPLMPCMECDSCQVGEYAQCTNYNYFGSRCNGGFAQYLNVPVWNLVFVPEDLSYEHAAMCEPAAVAVHALRRFGVDIGDIVSIFGAGPIGIMLGLWSKAWGASKVILIDIDQRKLTFAREQGFDNLCNSSEENPVEYIKSQTGGKGADLVVEGTGISKPFESAMFAAKTFGKIVCMGNPAKEMSISQQGYWQILRKQLTIKGTWNSTYATANRNEWALSLEAMSTGTLNVRSLITHRFSLDDGIAPFETMRDRKIFFNKVMFLPNGEN